MTQKYANNHLFY